MGAEETLKFGRGPVALVNERETNSWAVVGSSNGDRHQVSEFRSGGQDFRLHPKPGKKRAAGQFGVQKFFLPQMREDIVEHDEPTADFPCALGATIL